MVGTGTGKLNWSYLPLPVLLLLLLGWGLETGHLRHALDAEFYNREEGSV